MKEAILLCYRDLVTPKHHTIESHCQIIRSHSYCWWGWWKKPFEVIPDELFDLADSDTLEARPTILYDCGLYELYMAGLSAVAVSFSEAGIPSPERGATPAYYA